MKQLLVQKFPRTMDGELKRPMSSQTGQQLRLKARVADAL